MNMETPLTEVLYWKSDKFKRSKIEAKDYIILVWKFHSLSKPKCSHKANE